MTRKIGFHLDRLWEIDLYEYVQKPPPNDLLPPFDLYDCQDEEAVKLVTILHWDAYLRDFKRLQAGRSQYDACELNSVAVGQDGTVYVADSGNVCIWKVSPQGKVFGRIECTVPPEQRTRIYPNARSFPMNFFTTVESLVAGRDGFLFFNDSKTGRILKMNPSGDVQGVSLLTESVKFAVDGTGRLLLSDAAHMLEIREFQDGGEATVTSQIAWPRFKEDPLLNPWMPSPIVADENQTAYIVPVELPYRLVTIDGAERVSEREIGPPPEEGLGVLQRDENKPEEFESSFDPLVLDVFIDNHRRLLFVYINGGPLDVVRLSGEFVGSISLSHKMQKFCFDGAGFLYDVDSSSTSRKARVAKYRLKLDFQDS